jgi:hypothetical protein
MPSGEVALMAGVGLAIPPTCAITIVLQTISAGKTAAITDNLIVAFILKPAKPSDIGQSLVLWSEAGGLPMRFPEFRMQTIAMLLWPTADFSDGK